MFASYCIKEVGSWPDVVYLDFNFAHITNLDSTKILSIEITYVSDEFISFIPLIISFPINPNSRL